MNRRFELKKRSQLFIRVDDETFSVAMRICNPDRSPVGEFACDFVSSRGTSGSGGSPKNETASSQTWNKGYGVPFTLIASQ